MLIDSQYRKTVGFLCARTWRKPLEPVATAFFVGIQAGPRTIVYAVTARHVIEQHANDALVLRVRSKKGPSVDLAAPLDKWNISQSSDVAAIRIAINDVDHDTYWIGRESLVTRQRIALNEITFGMVIGEGDDVFYPGLYYKHAGADTLLPVVRFGHIALMPYEPIPIEWNVGKVKRKLEVDGYLVECKSWHGFSGSPVFLYYPVEEYTHRRLKEPDGANRFPASSAELLGMVSSYWDYELDRRRRYRANAGLAVVIHADDVAQVIDSEEFMKERDEIAKMPFK